jgi:hypothetical protein
MRWQVEHFVLWECDLFGRRVDVGSFLMWFKELSGEGKEGFLLSVMGKYGVNSEQFYFVVQGFVFYVMIRHGVYWDEDVFQEAFLSIMEKVKYWDKERGSLLSFLYSLIRDRVSQKKYWESVRSVRDKGAGEFDSYDGVDEEWEDVYDGGEEVFRDVLLKEVSNRVVYGLRGEVLESILKGDDSVYRRVVLWKMEEKDAMV